MSRTNAPVITSALFTLAALSLSGGTCGAAAPPIREVVTPHNREAEFKKALARTVTFPGIEDPRTTLGDVLDHLGKTYDLSFHANEQAFKADGLADVLKARVARDSPVPPMKTTLGTVLNKGLSRIPARSAAVYVVRPDAIEITTRSARMRELGLPPDTRGPLVEKRFRKVPLNKALEAIAAESDFGLLIDVREGRKTRVKVTARLDQVPAEAALELLADMAGLAVVKRGGLRYVTSPDNAARMRKEESARPKTKDAVFHVRPPHTGFSLPRSARNVITLRGALEAVGEDAGVNVLVDVRVEKKTRVKVRTGAARLWSVPAEAGLELLADMAGLAVVRRSNVYYVTSPANAARLKSGPQATEGRGP